MPFFGFASCHQFDQTNHYWCHILAISFQKNTGHIREFKEMSQCSVKLQNHHFTFHWLKKQHTLPLINKNILPVPFCECCFVKKGEFPNFQTLELTLWKSSLTFSMTVAWPEKHDIDQCENVMLVPSITRTFCLWRTMIDGLRAWWCQVSWKATHNGTCPVAEDQSKFQSANQKLALWCVLKTQNNRTRECEHTSADCILQPWHWKAHSSTHEQFSATIVSIFLAHEGRQGQLGQCGTQWQLHRGACPQNFKSFPFKNEVFSFLQSQLPFTPINPTTCH